MGKYKQLLAVLAVGLVAAQAQATTQAQVTVSNLSYQLKDLNPADGVAAALDFGAAPGLATMSTYEQAQSGWSVGGWGSTTFFTAQFKTPLYGYDDRYGSSGSLVQAGATVSVQQSPLSFGQLSVQASADVGQRLTARGFYYKDIVLGAGTQVTFSVLVSGSFSGDASPMSLQPGQFASNNHSDAIIYSFIGANGLSSTLNQTGANDFYSNLDAYEQSVDGQLLKLTIKNTTSTSKSYQLTIGATASVGELTAPIPEPSTYALMALGLLGVGAAARRQRRS